MEAMICDSKMARCLFDACKNFTKVIFNPDMKHRQGLKKQMVEVSLHDKSGILKRSLSIPRVNKSKSKKCTMEKVFLPDCAEQVISYLSMTPVTSPNNHSPVKPIPGMYPTMQENKSNRDIDDVQDANGLNLNSIHNHSKDTVGTSCINQTSWKQIALTITT